MIVATPAEHRALAAALRLDKRQDGAGGRALLRDFPVLGLAHGNRVEPCVLLPDVAQFDDHAIFLGAAPEAS